MKLFAAVSVVVLVGSFGGITLVDAAGAASGNAKYVVTLTGSAEVPPSGAATTGQAILTVTAKTARVCVLIKKVGPNAAPVPAGNVAIAAHLHQAPAGSNGPIVLPLAAPVLVGKKYQRSRTCVDGTSSQLISSADVESEPVLR